MEVDVVVIMDYIYGGLAVIFFTVLRYLILSKVWSSKLRRLLNSFKVIDIRQDILEVKLMLLQYTGVAYLLLGTVYGFFLKRVEIRGLMADSLELIVLFGPGLLLIIIMGLLRKFIWR